jgi:hypothetical protein
VIARYVALYDRLAEQAQGRRTVRDPLA